MPKRPIKAQASSTRAFGSGFGTTTLPFASFSTTSALSYVWEPPDLRSISDANIVVAFKNLSKRDSTTKAKALEELQGHIASLDTIEESILETWISFYPRTSIEESRRVRQLAHVLQGRISQACGKRIARFMPQVVGAWLAGTYDPDRAVARSASAALHLVFSNPDKLQGLRKVYQVPLLEFCQNIVDNETPQTLTDERTASPDEVESKYNRVLATAVLMTNSLLSELPADVVQLQQSTYVDLLSDDKLWTWSHSGEPLVRRAVHRLLRTALSRHPDLATPALPKIGKAYISHGLRSDQTTTSLDFVESLSSLLAVDPNVWQEHNPGSKGINRLCSFLQRGSQMGPPEFWPSVTMMIQQIPSKTLIDTQDDAQKLLTAMRAGINRKDEPRANIAAAWRSYINVAQYAADALTYESMNALLEAQIHPLIKDYVRPTDETASWRLPDQAASAIIDGVLENAATRSVVARTWPEATKRLIEEMQISQPEQSKDFRASQDTVAKHGSHWVAVLSALRRRTDQEDDETTVWLTSLEDVLSAAMGVLEARKGKPYGSAFILESALAAMDVPRPIVARLQAFVQESLPDLFLSPSAKPLAAVLYSFSEQPWFKETWERTADVAVHGGEESEKALHDLMASPRAPEGFDLASKSPALRSFIDDKTHKALAGALDWTFLKDLIGNDDAAAANGVLVDDVLTKLASGLSQDSTTEEALKGFQMIADTDRALAVRALQTSDGTQIMSRLLLLSESADETIAQTATALTSLIQHGIGQSDGVGPSHEVLYKTIRSGLLETSPSSISTHVLVSLAEEFIEKQGPELPESAVLELLPPIIEWRESLQPFLTVSSLPSAAITGPLKGVVHLISRNKTTSSSETLLLPRDAEGYSSALRMALYATALFKKLPLSKLPTNSNHEVVKLLGLSLVLANDNLGVAGANHLWSQYIPEVESDMSEMVSSIKTILKAQSATASTFTHGHTSNAASSNTSSLEAQLLKDSEGVSNVALKSAELYVDLVEEQASELQNAMQENVEIDAAMLRKSHNIVALAALLVGKSSLFSSALIQRWCNELVAELTSHDLSADFEGGIYKLILLNTLFSAFPDSSKGIARQRAVFFMKHIIPWSLDTSSYPLRAEVATALLQIMPSISDLYGEHWAQLLKLATACWLSAPSLDPGRPEQHTCLPAVHATLRLYGAMTTAASRTDVNTDPNDDLVEALKDSESDIASALFHLLSMSQDCPDEYNQPLRIVNNLLSRFLPKLDSSLYPAREQWYSYLVSPSFAVQTTVYGALHEMIPKAQEQISLDAALEGKVAELPQEMLSLILDPPTTKDLVDAQWESSMPLPLRGYLLSWLLLFDHFSGSSQRVKTEYVESLKGVDKLPSLLDFIFDFLGQGRKALIDASKFNIASYDVSQTSEDAKQDCQQLLAHVYYLALRYVPGLVKRWWIDLRARALVPMIESWTEKYVSPDIIAAALRAVSQWAQEQSDPSNPNAAPDNERLKITVSERASEVRASYDIDEQTMSILIRLPGAWPLRQAEVHGVNRVGIDEKKWQSWVRGCQGVITFSNNSLIDGLVAFRRNVTGAMKGQTECAICYSIISADKQLPSKKCSTCKNLFHSGCLYRWFKTSNASTCPLCRNPFNYG